MSRKIVNPTKEEKPRKRSDAILSATFGQGKVLAGITHSGIESESALVVKDCQTELIRAIIGIAQVVVEISRGATFGQDGLVVFDGCGIITLSIGFVSLASDVFLKMNKGGQQYEL